MPISFVKKYSKLILVVWLLLSALGVVGALQLNGAVKAGGFNDENGTSFVGQEVNEHAFGDPANQLTVVLNSDSRISSEVLDNVSTGIETLPNIDSVIDGRALDSLSSDSGKTQILQVGVAADNTTTQNMIPDLRDRVETAVEGEEVTSHVTGAPALDYDLNIQSQQDALRAEIIAFPLLILVLLLIYRAVGPTLVTLLVAGACLIGTQGIGTLLASFLDVSNMYITAASLIGLAVSVDYCLFLIARYKEFLIAGHPPEDALRRATNTAGHSIRFGGLSVIAALCALFIARNMVFSSIAMAGIVVTSIALLALTTLVPAAIMLLGDRFFFGKLPGYEKTMRAPEDKEKRTSSLPLKSPLLAVVLIAVPLLIAATPLASIKLQVPVASSSILPAGMDSREGIEIIESELNARELFPTMVTFAGTEGQLAQELDAEVEEFLADIEEVPHVDQVFASGTPAEQYSPYPLSAEKEGRAYKRVVITSTDLPDSDAAHEMVADIKKAADEYPDTFVSGATAQGDDFDRLVQKSIPWIVGFVLLISLLLLGWAFRSWRLATLAVVLNGLVVSAAMGCLSLLWKAVTGEAINSVTPIVVFAIVFGLSMDYMVLMASRMKEQFASGSTHRDAIAEGVAHTSRLIISAAIIMIGVFLSFMVAEISIIQELGLGLAMAVALDALIVRPILLPATLALLGEKVWGKAQSTSSN